VNTYSQPEDHRPRRGNERQRLAANWTLLDFVRINAATIDVERQWVTPADEVQVDTMLKRAR